MKPYGGEKLLTFLLINTTMKEETSRFWEKNRGKEGNL
jgi:hypothetical protein